MDNISSLFNIIQSEKSILSIEKIVSWKRSQNSYNFKNLPKTVILTPKNNYIYGFKKIIYKKIKGISGENYILNKDYLLSSSFGNGAPSLISHLEELHELGVENLVFIGYAGILNPQLKEGELYLVEKAFSTSGTSFFYFNNDEISYKNKLSKQLKEHFNLLEKMVISTDAPFRETPSFIKNYLVKEVDLIDMETASILAFSKYYNIHCACILIASDRIENLQWLPPKNMEKLSKKINTVIDKLIKI